MATDDERRRVAERMRASAGKYDFCASNIALDMGIVGSDYSEGYNARHRLAWLRLAELIEPTCDRDGLLALADEMNAVANYAHETTRSESAREHIRRISYYAQRIREACGEVDG